MNRLELKYEWGQPYDENLKEMVKTAKYFMQQNDDDFRLLIVGETGTGKSTLGLHIGELVNPNITIDYIGLNPKAYAKALGHAAKDRRDGKKDVYCQFDEANVLGVDAMTPFNKDLLRLFAEIRGLNIFHTWCTAVPGALQRIFLDDSFDNGMIFVADKSKDKPRIYYYFSKRALTRMRDREGTRSQPARLSTAFLKEKAGKYATYRGCFTPYKGHLVERYSEEKLAKMTESVARFSEKYSEDLETQASIAKEWGVSDSTVRGWVKNAIHDRWLEPEKDYKTNAAGIVKLTKSGKDKLYARYGRSPIYPGGDVS